MARCEICGVSSLNIGLVLNKAMGTGDLKKCPVCGLTYCTNCAVAIATDWFSYERQTCKDGCMSKMQSKRVERR